MDPVVAAIISGLLGGGVAGAIIGGLVTIRQQRRAFEHEKETRFIDVRRSVYPTLGHRTAPGRPVRVPSSEESGGPVRR